jgi:hypothetical protein
VCLRRCFKKRLTFGSATKGEGTAMNVRGAIQNGGLDGIKWEGGGSQPECADATLPDGVSIVAVIACEPQRPASLAFQLRLTPVTLQGTSKLST